MNKINETRLNKKWSYQTLAEKSGLSIGSVGRICRGEDCRVSNLEKILKALEIVIQLPAQPG